MRDPIKTVCVLTNTSSPSISGTIRFEEDLNKNDIIIKINVEGLQPGKHGFHIHQAGDLTDGCTSACAHFNPYNKVHGGPHSKLRHVGDLGNIRANSFGKAKTVKRDHIIKLRGKNSIVGRMVVIHKDTDDLGLGGLGRDGKVVDEKTHTESLKTGNAGARIACGVIGYAKEN